MYKFCYSICFLACSVLGRSWRLSDSAQH